MKPENHKDIIFRSAIPDDAGLLARMHKKNINQGFLSQMSISFLELLYRFLATNEIVYVCEKGSRILGFITASMNTRQLYKKFFRKHFIIASIILFPKMFYVETISRMFETATTPFKRIKSDKTKQYAHLPELLSIAVDPKNRNTGIAHDLLKRLEIEFVRKEKDRYCVIAGEELEEANNFYLKNGFIIKEKIAVHQGSISNLYVKQLDAV